MTGVNEILRKLYDKMKAAGDKNVYYVPTARLFGERWRGYRRWNPSNRPRLFANGSGNRACSAGSSPSPLNSQKRYTSRELRCGGQFSGHSWRLRQSQQRRPATRATSVRSCRTTARAAINLRPYHPAWTSRRIETFRKGGKHGPAFVSGKPDDSLAIRYVTGAMQPRMPLGGEALKSRADRNFARMDRRRSAR